MILVECLRQIALTKSDPDEFMADLKTDLLRRARQLDMLRDDKDNVVPTHVAAAITMVFDVALAKLHSCGNAAVPAWQSVDGADHEDLEPNE